MASMAREARDVRDELDPLYSSLQINSRPTDDVPVLPGGTYRLAIGGSPVGETYWVEILPDPAATDWR